jgi:Putative Flp pilus-assembly TadE/G-like
MRQHFQNRKKESGQTLLLVVVAMAVLVGMAALAIDIATLYTAHNETRRAAEAAALAGAHAIATSGVTSGWLTQAQACSGNVGSPGLAEQQALSVVAQSPVGGGAATLQAVSCNFGTPTNPQFTVTVQRTGLPTFFGRIWGSFPGSSTATATAEVYNSSGGSSRRPIQVGSVKPWAVPNCDPTHSSPPGLNCGGTAATFVNTTTGAISNSIVGTVLDITEVPDNGSITNWATPTTPPITPPPPAGNLNMLAVDVPITATSASCPASGTLSCNATLQPATPGYPETIACANSTPLSCGQTLNVDSNTGSGGGHIFSEPAALCLIHANNRGRNMGQDQFCNNATVPNCPSGSPISIDGGSNNPDPLLRGQNSISRSDSVIAVPIFTPCAGGGCINGSVTIVGFLEIGVTRVRNTGPLRTILTNVVGCQGTTGTPVSGGGVSPLPVRLVQ